MTEEKMSMLMKAKREKIKKLRPMDDLCSTIFFQDKDCIQMLLREIIDDHEIEIETTESQKSLQNIFGRSARLDVLAFDKADGVYNIEFQRKKGGAVIDRAFFNHGRLSQQLVAKGTEFEDFPHTYIVFVQEKDFFATNKPVLKIKFILDEENPVPLESKLNIFYVNANAKDLSTPLGKMLHDILCANSEDMLTPAFAARMKQIKHPEGKEMGTMCELLEEVMEEGRQIGVEEGRQIGVEEGRQIGVEEGRQIGVEEGRQIGVEEGRQIGVEEGRQIMVKEMAQEMFKRGAPFEYIEEMLRTRLSQEDLLQIQREVRKESAQCR